MRSTVAQWFIRHSETISGRCYILGNIILIFKNGIHVDIVYGFVQHNLEAFAAVLLILGGVAIEMAARRPVFMKIGGGFVMAGAGCLALSAFGLAGFGTQLLGAVPLFLAGLFMATQTNNYVPLRSDNSALRAYSFIRSKPVLSAGIVQIPGRPFLMISGVLRGDVWFCLAALSWMVADLGLMASDPSAKRLMEKT